MINYSYYRNYNSSKTIVLLHGWGVNSSYMESLKDFLLEDYSILLLDLPGHGKSYLNKVYKIEDYVDELFYIVNKEKITSLYGIGHSFGGKILGMYAKKYPLEGGILIAPSLIKPRFSLSLFIKIRIYKILRKLKLKIPKCLQGSYDYRNSSGLKRETFLNVHKAYLKKKELNKIKTKFIVIGFTKDKSINVYQVRRLNKYLLNSKLFIYEGNHFGYFSYFKEIRILLTYLTRGENDLFV